MARGRVAAVAGRLTTPRCISAGESVLRAREFDRLVERVCRGAPHMRLDARAFPVGPADGVIGPQEGHGHDDAVADAGGLDGVGPAAGRERAMAAIASIPVEVRTVVFENPSEVVVE